MLPHMPDPQRVNKTIECYPLAVLNGTNNIVGRFRSHPIQIFKHIFFESKYICIGKEKVLVHQLIDQFLAQPIDVKGPFWGKMFYPFLYLGRTWRVDTPQRRFIFGSYDRRAADRAANGHIKGFLFASPLWGYHFNNFGNHVTGSLNQDRIADSDVFSFYFIFIVKGRPANRHTSDFHRLKMCYRRQCQ